MCVLHFDAAARQKTRLLSFNLSVGTGFLQVFHFAHERMSALNHSSPSQLGQRAVGHVFELDIKTAEYQKQASLSAD